MKAHTDKLITQVADVLIRNRLKLATAESCTGGGLSFTLTNLAGSSTWFDRGFVTYSDLAKIEMLHVDPTTIATFGAVSKETAQEMAMGALAQSGADLSIAITGIAGPTGGSADKPVGTVWIAWGTSGRVPAACYHFSGDRQNIRLLTIEKALEKLLDILKESHNNKTSDLR